MAASPLVASSLAGAPDDAAEACTAVVERPDLAWLFTAEGTQGCFAARRFMPGSSPEQTVLVDPARAARRLPPASTFKLVTALAAVEFGVVVDADHPAIPWDGRTRPNPDWNRDHTLRSGFAASALPAFQEIVRRIGRERLAGFVRRLDYGNADLGSGPLETAWLGQGGLRISALEQVAFLERLRRGTLPVSAHARAVLHDIALLDEAGEARLYGKTGGLLRPALGWFVGWVEAPEGGCCFALNMDTPDPRLTGRRIPLARDMLAELGWL
ncbi:hypothetical protein LPC08_19790 [Roseomonas sp. OT10]|uniref:penicillin-binding transpeptidase domain-containing protein n=1 Tax=Roseomonas cutis TaxID=2897332 RepID=UPI001E2C6356|nr:penicillin-binding transpeptidase domain-containing protein [Roseomonas sp. OT10]UFN48233.1 hypothetical protein LPC08_19790 [Roseomonas sp. OT10]